MILNNFIERRIGFETMTLFRIKLNVKLNSIMPTYNKMFDMLDGWDIFQQGEEINRIVSDSRNINTVNNQNINGTTNNSNNTTTSTQNNSQTNANTTIDNRKSDTPQNELEDVRNGSYVSDYEYKTDIATGTDTSTATGTSNSTGTNTENKTIATTEETTNDGNLQETINKSPQNKLKLYTEFIEKRQHIYSLIFNELECLFYQLV